MAVIILIIPNLQWMSGYQILWATYLNCVRSFKAWSVWGLLYFSLSSDIFLISLCMILGCHFSHEESLAAVKPPCSLQSKEGLFSGRVCDLLPCFCWWDFVYITPLMLRSKTAYDRMNTAPHYFLQECYTMFAEEVLVSTWDSPDHNGDLFILLIWVAPGFESKGQIKKIEE